MASLREHSWSAIDGIGLVGHHTSGALTIKGGSVQVLVAADEALRRVQVSDVERNAILDNFRCVEGAVTLGAGLQQPRRCTCKPAASVIGQ